MFAHVVKKERCTASRPAVYLDGPDAALTKHLLKEGCDPEALMPVNNNVSAAAMIESECPNVRCVVDDICRLAACAERDSYGTVWFDMCGVDFGDFRVQELLHCADTKFFTLSCRQIVCSSQQDALCSALLQAKETIIERSLYTGVSGKALNMVFVASKTNVKSFATTTTTAVPSLGRAVAQHEARAVVGTVVKFPIRFWKTQDFVQAYNYKVFDGCHLLGAVHSQVSNSASMFRLSFQVVGGGTLLCSSKYTLQNIMTYAV